MIARSLGSAALVVALGACTVISPVPPITYLQLRSGELPAPAGDSPVVLFDAVKMPDYLLRDELLRRRDDHTLRYDPYQRWAEPLDLGIQRVLAQRLSGLLGTRRVLRFPEAPAREVDAYLEVTLHEFEARDDRVHLRARGTWRGPERETAVVDFDDTRTLDAGDAENIAEALSTLLWEFAGALAEAGPQTR